MKRILVGAGLTRHKRIDGLNVSVSNREILEYLRSSLEQVSRVGIVRDINMLFLGGLVKKEGPQKMKVKPRVKN